MVRVRRMLKLERNSHAKVGRWTTKSASWRGTLTLPPPAVRHLANGKHETVTGKFVRDTAPDSCVCVTHCVTGHQPHCPQFRTLEAERRASRLTFEVRASTARALVQEEAASLDDASDGRDPRAS